MKDYARITIAPGIIPDKRGSSTARAAAQSAAAGERVVLVVRSHHDRARLATEALGLHVDQQTRGRLRRGEERIEYKSGGWVRFITERQADSCRGHVYDMVLVDYGF